MTSKKKEKSDDSEVEFIGSMRNDGQMYSVTVICKEGLTDKEFGDCLVVFAKEIYEGKVTFDDAQDIHSQ